MYIMYLIIFCIDYSQILVYIWIFRYTEKYSLLAIHGTSYRMMVNIENLQHDAKSKLWQGPGIHIHKI
jgi:hypothetical protein